MAIENDITNNNDDNNQYYFDDEKIGLHQQTSHPNFVKYFVSEFYYDCSDEEAPFGSDEGFDTLLSLVENLQEKREVDFLDFPRYLIEEEWNMKYIPAKSLDEDYVKRIIELDESDIILSDIVTCATAFGQIKITGKINCELKQQAINAMKRRNMVAKILGWGEESEIISQMISDLSMFEA